MNASGEIQTGNLEEFRSFARDLASLLRGNEILLLSGEMGAGKTEFARTLAKAWGVSGVVSPTFALHSSYHSHKGALDHFDLYRVENEDELETTGLWEILQGTSLVLVEWPERVSEKSWPRSRRIIRIQIEKRGSEGRRISWRA